MILFPEKWTWVQHLQIISINIKPICRARGTTELGWSTLIFMKFLLLKKLTLLRRGIQLNRSNKQISTNLLKHYIYILVTVKMKFPIILIIIDVDYHLSIKQYLSSTICEPWSSWNQADAKLNAPSLKNVWLSEKNN